MHIKTIGPKTANIMIVGEAPGAEEEKQLLPFVGASGSLLDQVLKEIGLSRYEVMLTNVAREKPPGNNINYFFIDGAKRTQPKDFMQRWIDELKREVQQYRPNIIIALGDIPYWTLCGQRGITKARGYIHESTLVKGQKILPTFHPSHVLRNWSNRFHFMLDIAKAKRNSETPDMPVDNRVHITSISLGKYLKYLKELKETCANPIAVDIETTKTGFIDTIGIAESSQKAVTFTFCNRNQPIYSPDNELKVWIALAELFETVPVIMQNGKFDLASLWAKNRVLIKNFVFDTLVAGHVIWPEAPRSLAFLTSICTNFPMWKDTAMTQPLLYNAQDCTNTYAVYEQQKGILEKDFTLMNTFKEEMKQNELSAMLEIQGVQVDKVKQELLSQDCNTKIKQLEEDLKTRFNKAVNVKSPKQMQTLLYDTLGLPVQYQRRINRNDAKKITTDAKAMKKLARESKNPDLNTIMDLKKLYKLLSFIDIPLSPTGKVHTCYNITGANMSLVSKASNSIEDSEGEHKSFGRWSSSKSIIFPFGSGNLQNVPKTARKMYTVPEGYKLLQCDYKQAEAVVVAYLINDQRLIKLFEDSFGKSKAECKKNGWDVHVLTFLMMHGLSDFSSVTKDQRKEGKQTRHATNYNMGAKTLANNIGVSLAEGKERLTKFHNACPQLQLWHKEIQAELNRTRTLTNLLGRKHKFMDRWGDNLFRSAYSFMPQSTVGDLLNQALVKLYNQHGDWLTIYLQLHDAIYVVVKEEEIGKAISSMMQCMLTPLECKGRQFTIDVDFSIGDNWGEMEEIEWMDYVN